jgi:hypothetical protein
MEREEIEALEPKYTGNERHLTEGEAAEIVHETNYTEIDDGALDDIVGFSYLEGTDDYM